MRKPHSKTVETKRKKTPRMRLGKKTKADQTKPKRHGGEENTDIKQSFQQNGRKSRGKGGAEVQILCIRPCL